MGSTRFVSGFAIFGQVFLGVSEACLMTAESHLNLWRDCFSPNLAQSRSYSLSIYAIYSINHLTEIEWLEYLYIYTAVNLFVSKIQASLVFRPFILQLFVYCNARWQLTPLLHFLSGFAGHALQRCRKARAVENNFGRCYGSPRTVMPGRRRRRRKKRREEKKKRRREEEKKRRRRTFNACSW